MDKTFLAYISRAIITTMAHKFQPDVQVVHDDARECRSRGGESCSYIITW